MNSTAKVFVAHVMVAVLWCQAANGETPSKPLELTQIFGPSAITTRSAGSHSLAAGRIGVFDARKIGQWR